MGQRPVLHDSDESEDGGVTMLPGTHTLDSNSRFFLSSAGKNAASLCDVPGAQRQAANFPSVHQLPRSHRCWPQAAV